MHAFIHSPAGLVGLVFCLSPELFRQHWRLTIQPLLSQLFSHPRPAPSHSQRSPTIPTHDPLPPSLPPALKAGATLKSRAPCKSSSLSPSLPSGPSPAASPLQRSTARRPPRSAAPPASPGSSTRRWSWAASRIIRATQRRTTRRGAPRTGGSSSTSPSPSDPTGHC